MLAFFTNTTAQNGNDAQTNHLSEKIEFSWNASLLCCRSKTSLLQTHELEWGPQRELGFSHAAAYATTQEGDSRCRHLHTISA